MEFRKTKLYSNYIAHKKVQFVLNLPENTNVLDIGCGNHSPSFFKKLNQGINYYGIDIQEYNIDESDYTAAQKLFFCKSQNFAESIKKMGNDFDVIVSAHNLEHTDKPMEVIESMMFCLKKGGRLYLSFPCERSAKFPSRKGTLNFFDDETHQYLPDYNKVCEQIIKHNGKIVKSTRRSRSLYGVIKGLLQEPFSIVNKKIYSHTWQVWGFETVIIAEKL